MSEGKATARQNGRDAAEPGSNKNAHEQAKTGKAKIVFIDGAAVEWHSLEILSCGAGMQSTALALMACQNAKVKQRGKALPFPLVPIYDLVVWCDLGFEPPWVMDQVKFIQKACEQVGIWFKVLEAPLYADFVRNFGERRTISVPWWTLRDDGHKARMPRHCTVDYKVKVISQYIRWEVLGYKKGQRLRAEDKHAHKMHMGFSAEEANRCKESPNQMFVNRYPLVDMGLTRADNFRYIKDVWGLETRASACCFCPYHRNYFYMYLKENLPETYKKLVGIDELLRDKNPRPPMDSALFMSRARKRLTDLTEEDYNDAECFDYCGQQIWNGF